MTGSSSGASTSTGLAEVRSYDTMGNQKTPRTLSIIIKLIILLYLIMMGIASINLGINISRQEESQLDINTIKLAYDRMNFLAVNLVLFRVLLNIANEYEPNSSPMSADRFWRYKLLQEESIDNFKRVQSNIQQSKFLKSDIFKDFEQTQSVELNYLSESNEVYKQNEFLNVAFNSYLAKLMEVHQYDRENMKGNIGVQKLGGFKDGDKYLPTLQEQILYFVAQNGILPLRRAAIDACFLYAREAEKHATESISTTLLTAIISIVSIVVIGLLLSPMLTKAETRRFQAIFYFLKIPRDQFPILISKIEAYCLHLRDEETYAAIQKEYERLLGIKLINQQIDQLRETDNNYGKKERDQLNDIEMMSSSPPSSYTYSQPPSKTTNLSVMISKKQFAPKTQAVVDYTAGLHFNKEQESMNSFEVQNENEPMVPSRITFSNSKQFLANTEQFGGDKESLAKVNDPSKITVNNNIESDFQTKAVQFRPNIPYQNNDLYVSKISNESDNSQEKGQTKRKKSSKSRVIEDFELIGKFQKPKKKSSLMHASGDGQNLQGSKGRIQSGMEVDSIRQLASSDRSSNDQQKRSQSSFKEEDEESEKTIEEFPNEIALQAKEAIIKQSIFRKQVVMIISILGVIAFLSTYFLISYFLSIQTFQTASEVIVALEVVFQKGACLDFSIVFMRASQIRNSTILVRSATQSSFEMTGETYYNAADYYIDFCNQKEQEFMQLRKNMPPFFQEIVPFLQAIESPQVCEKFYKESENQELISFYPLCKEALNGIMVQGLSNAFTHLINIIRKANLMFSSEERTEDFLKKQMGDPVMVEIIDMKAKVVNPLLEILNQKSMGSVISYVHSLFLNFLTAFIMFTVILTICMLVLLLVGFRVMKRNMLDTNIVLRIIPFEKLAKEDCEEIKDFFKQ